MIERSNKQKRSKKGGIPARSDLRSRDPFFLSLTVTCLLLVIQFVFFRAYYQVNDDSFKIFFTQGVGTDLRPSEFMGYSNPLWGHVFKTLFTFFPHVPWYGILMLATQSLSMWALLYAFLLTANSKFKLFLFSLFFFGAYSMFFASIQFTITSIMAAQSALFLILCLWKEEKLSGNPLALWLSGVLLFVSSLIRLDALLLLIIAALPLPVFLWIEADPAARKRLLTQKAFILFFSILIAGGGLYDHFWYERSPDWSAFNRFDHERVDLMDYRIDPYNEKNRPIYEKAGWTENDFNMFKDWYFMDKDIYGANKMNELADHFSRFGTEGKPYSAHSLIETLASTGAQTMLLYFLVFLLWTPPKILRFLFAQFIWVLGIFLFLIYFLGSRDRVTLPILMYLVSLSILYADPVPEKGGKGAPKARNKLLKTALAATLLLVPLTGSSYYNAWKGNQIQKRTEAYLDSSLSTLAPKDDHLYVTWDSAFPYEAFNVLDNFELFRTFHVFTLAVYQRCPNAQIMLDRFHIKDLMMDLVDNPRVSLICWPKEGAMYRQYMREKHHMEIYPEKTFDCLLFKIFRIHSKPAGPHGWPSTPSKT